MGGLVAMTVAGEVAVSSERLQFDRLPVLLGPGQRLVLSGDVNERIDGQDPVLVGPVRADEGVIEIRSAFTPRLAVDVRVHDPGVDQGRVHETGEPEVAAAQTPGPARAGEVGSPPDRKVSLSRVDLQVDLGDRFKVYGHGLEAWLGGVVRLTMDRSGPPRIHGTVPIRCGIWRGFGQDLQIEQGTLRFTGDPQDPVLDIVAWRRNQAVHAGIHVTGQASRPVLTLLMAGSDRAWPVRSQVSSFGLDLLSIRTAPASASQTGGEEGFAQDSIVTLGRSLTERLFLIYEQNLRGLQDRVRLQYQISEQVFVRLRVGRPTAIDLNWTRRDD